MSAHVPRTDICIRMHYIDVFNKKPQLFRHNLGGNIVEPLAHVRTAGENIHLAVVIHF